MRLLRKALGGLIDPEQHIGAMHPGYLLCQDMHFVGTIQGRVKGEGKIYQQTVINAHSSRVFARFYLSNVPMTAVIGLNDRVLPFYEELNVAVAYLLTDNSRGYCGRPVGRLFELYLAIQQSKHRRIDRGSPKIKGRAPSNCLKRGKTDW